MPKSQITAVMLYNLVACPHRLTMDLFGDPAERDETNPFVELLWERGALYEKEVMRGAGEPYLDLSTYPAQERERLTSQAMARGEALIYGGRIQVDDLVGVPDLLRKEHRGYVAGDIKSGAGEEGSEDLRKPKKHYAVQLALYTDILERKGLSTGRSPFVWDVHGDEVRYDLDAPQGPRKPETLWDEYLGVLEKARGIVARSASTDPAYGAECKLCHWYSACLARLREADDLTLLPELGRSRRDAMVTLVPTVSDLAKADTTRLLRGGRTVFPRIGPDMLARFQDRARLACRRNPQPYLREPITLPHSGLEIFFDIEVDPLRDICYLHGFIERGHGDNASERYVPFFADEPSQDAEGQAFADAWQYIQSRQPCVTYYYSKYERTVWRRLREKYPHVCREDELEDFFDPARAVDLFEIVRSKTEWPTIDHSIKTLAKFLGFGWRDPHPSGAASIQWYDRWVKSGDPTLRQRILEYNEDDCRATRVVLDAIRRLPVSQPGKAP